MVGCGAPAGGLTEEDIFTAAGPGGSDAFHDADSGVSNDGSSEQEASMMRTSTAGSNSLQVPTPLPLISSHIPQCSTSQMLQDAAALT